MSDDNSPVAEEKKKGRGRPAKKDVGEEKKDTPAAKKRGRTPAEKSEEKSGPSPAKRGRGRPKGSGKKAASKAKAKVENVSTFSENCVPNYYSYEG
ncbi:Hypothetical predicted protein [Cloeon dipterum]|uniref:Uncharacterized protein n=1 Tax=Cloeon dipterum TaxID=197152 RepID=A0A8S1DED4_9INSE|nr:Hypothetical predicted protein [Cloeon dipterum]